MPIDTPENEQSQNNGALLSLDAWAVIVALVLALAVRFELIKNVPW
jgi:hypothetical protein